MYGLRSVIFFFFLIRLTRNYMHFDYGIIILHSIINNIIYKIREDIQPCIYYRKLLQNYT